MKSVIKSLKAGSTISDACQAAGISVATFYHWRKTNPQLDKRVKDMYDSRIGIVEDALFKNALAGNVAAQIFFLKNRAVDRWRDKQEIIGDFKSEISLNADINLNGQFTDFAKRVSERLGYSLS